MRIGSRRRGQVKWAYNGCVFRGQEGNCDSEPWSKLLRAGLAISLTVFKVGFLPSPSQWPIGMRCYGAQLSMKKTLVHGEDTLRPSQRHTWAQAGTMGQLVWHGCQHRTRNQVPPFKRRQ